MAHVLQNEQYFLFRTKDIHQKGLVGKFDFPDDETFDITVNVTLVRSHSSKIDCGDTYRRFIDAATSFDYLAYGSDDTYPISFRVVRIRMTAMNALLQACPLMSSLPDASKSFIMPDGA